MADTLGTTTTRSDELEGLLRRAIDLADEVRPSFVIQRLLHEALESMGVEDHGLPERDPDPAPIAGPAEAPRFTTDRPQNLTPEAAEREKRAVVEAVEKARKARKEQLADPVEATAADLEDPEPERPWTDPNGPNHDDKNDAAFMGKNDNGSGVTRDDPLAPGVGVRNDQEPAKDTSASGTDTGTTDKGNKGTDHADVHTSSMTVASDSTTVNTGNTPGPADANKGDSK